MQYIIYFIHFTMKNEGWGIKEDQIPSSSHLLHQTMDSQLHLFIKLQMPSAYKLFWLELVLCTLA